MKAVVIWLLSNPLLYGGMAGRVKDGDVFQEEENPRYGFYWWYWLPGVHSNGGNVLRREILDINFCWFCFWFAVTSWPRK